MKSSMKHIILFLALLCGACAPVPEKPEDNRGAAQIALDARYERERKLREAMPPWTVVCNHNGDFGYTASVGGYVLEHGFKTHDQARNARDVFKAYREALEATEADKDKHREMEHEIDATFSECKDVK